MRSQLHTAKFFLVTHHSLTTSIMRKTKNLGKTATLLLRTKKRGGGIRTGKNGQRPEHIVV